MYGYGDYVERVVKSKTESSKMIYDELMYDITSRNEKRTQGRKWTVAWRKLVKIKRGTVQQKQGYIE